MGELRLPPSIRDDRGVALEPQIARLADLDPGVVFVQDPATIEATALTALAAGLDMLGLLWEIQVDDAGRRTYLGDRALLQGLRGTPAALLQALETLGHPNCTLVEGRGGIQYDGAALYDGYYTYGEMNEHWASFRVVVPVTGLAYTTTHHTRVGLVANRYKPVSRVYKGAVLVENHGFGAVAAPAGEASELLLGLSADGVTWYSRRLRRVSTAVIFMGTEFTCEWRAFGGVDVPVGTEVLYVALLNPDLTEFQSYERAAPITTAADLELRGEMTFRVMSGGGGG